MVFLAALEGYFRSTFVLVLPDAPCECCCADSLLPVFGLSGTPVWCFPPSLPACLPACLPARARLPACVPACVPGCLAACLPAGLPHCFTSAWMTFLSLLKTPGNP